MSTENSTPTRPEGALWDVSECAAFLGLSPSWVYKRAQAGELPAVRIGAALRFEPEEIRAWLRGQRPESKGLVKHTGPK